MATRVCMTRAYQIAEYKNVRTQTTVIYNTLKTNNIMYVLYFIKTNATLNFMIDRFSDYVVYKMEKANAWNVQATLHVIECTSDGVLKHLKNINLNQF